MLFSTMFDEPEVKTIIEKLLREEFTDGSIGDRCDFAPDSSEENLEKEIQGDGRQHHMCAWSFEGGFQSLEKKKNLIETLAQTNEAPAYVILTFTHPGELEPSSDFSPQYGPTHEVSTIYKLAPETVNKIFAKKHKI